MSSCADRGFQLEREPAPAALQIRADFRWSVCATRSQGIADVIFACELQCKRFSHEKVNSGFLRALRIAFPDQAIRMYAHPSHIEALESVLRHDGVSIADIEYVPIQFDDAMTLHALIVVRRTIRRIFDDAREAEVERILFLSYGAPMLFLAKRLLSARQNATLRCAFVLHGDFELIADDKIAPPAGLTPAPVPGVMAKARALRLARIPVSALRFASGWASKHWAGMVTTSLHRVFPLRRTMEWRANDRIRYLALSQHVFRNAKRYIDVAALGIRTVVMPISYAPVHPLPDNAIPRFAVFGYGNSAMLHAVLSRLWQLHPGGGYEVRIIGMDDRGTSGFPNVTAPAKGKPLSRARMEELALDVDMFLSLYTAESYRLSCSGSIFEVLSNLKPVLHFPNECIDEFDRPEQPIGIRARDIDAYVLEMIAIIDNYPAFLARAPVFRDNLLALRERYSMVASAAMLRNALTWTQRGS